MQRVTITIEDDLLATVDKLVGDRGYAGRSEAVRDLIRKGLSEDVDGRAAEASCVASLTFVAEHGTRDLPQRIAEWQSLNHQLVLTQMQVPLDHDASFYTMVLRGPVAQIRRFADQIATQRGVCHDHLAVIPATIIARRHSHGSMCDQHEHIEIR